MRARVGRGPIGAAVVALGLTAAVWGQPPATKSEMPKRESGATTPPSEHVIYIPYAKLSDVFEKDGRNVLIPFAQYQRLWDAFRQLGQSLTPPPVPAVITQIQYAGRVEGDTAKITARLSVDVLSTDWVRLPVVFRNAAIAKVEGATFGADRPGHSVLLLSGRGKKEVTVELVTPIERSPEGRRIAWQGPQAGSAAMDFVIPETGLEVDVTPKLATPQLQVEDKTTRVVQPLGSTDAVTIAWRARAETVAAQPLVIAATQTLITVGDGVVHTRAAIDYQLLRGELGEFSLTLPAGDRVLEVSAAGLRDWKAATTGDRQTVTVRLHAPVRGKTTFVIDTERPLAAGPMAVATLRPAGVQRDTGVVALTAGDEWTLALAQRQGVSRVEPSEVPENLRRPGGLYVKYYSGEFTLAVTAAAVSPRVAVQTHGLYRLEENRLRSEFTFQFDVQRAGVFALRIALPANAELEEVSSPALDRYEMGVEAARPILQLQLKQKSQGAIPVRLVLSTLRPQPETALVLPIPEPLEVRSELGQLAVLAHESFELTTEAARTKGVRLATATELTSRGLAIPQEPRMNLAATYRFTDRPIDVVFQVKRRKTRLVAEVFTRVHVRENAVITKSLVEYDVQYSGTDTLQLELPEAIAGRSEITGTQIKEKRSGPAKDGYVPYTVVLHTRALGRQSLAIRFEEPLGLREGETAPRGAPIRLPRPLGIERESGQIAVSKERTISLEDKIENLEPIDPRQLTRPPPTVDAKDNSEIQLAYRYYRHPARLELVVAKHAIQRVIETVITRALMDAVLADDGATTYRAMYQMQSSQRQRLGLRLPEGARVLGVNVAGRIVQPERDPKGDARDFLINISRSTSADEPFSMVVLYDVPRHERLETLTLTPWSAPKVSLRMPEFGSEVSMQRLYWRAWLPKRFTALGTPTGFENEIEPWKALGFDVAAHEARTNEIDRWTTEWSRSATANLFEFPLIGRPFVYSSLAAQAHLELGYGFVPTMVVMASVLAAGAMLLAAGMRWESKVTLVLLAAAAGAALSLYQADAVVRWLAAAEPGIAFGTVFWLLGGLSRWRQRWRTRPVTAPATTPPAPSPASPAASADASEGEPGHA